MQVLAATGPKHTKMAQMEDNQVTSSRSPWLPIAIMIGLAVLLVGGLKLMNSEPVPANKFPQAQSLQTEISGSLQPQVAAIHSDESKTISSLNSDSVQARFAAVNALLVSNQDAQAMADLQAIIHDYPNAADAYLNLASLYAKAGKLDKARSTLVQGLEVSRSTARLFENLKKINGALAAQSYQKALDVSSQHAVNVPIEQVEMRPTRLIEPNRTLELHAYSVEQLKAILATARDKLTDAEKKLAVLEQRLLQQGSEQQPAQE